MKRTEIYKTMLAERKRILAAVFAVLSAALIFLLCCMHAGVTARAGAAELCRYDQTKIGEDLQEIDLSAYPKNENDVHRLIDGAGFMEYGFSNEESIAGSYYGVYFYVYNPTQREISTRAGANVVNMAVRYDSAGNPTAYENRELLLLDKTENNRFYKFRIANASALYALEKQYQSAHGERRYDVAGLQLWFVGDNNATDSRAGKSGELGVSFSFRCTGYAAGCGPDGSEESTLEMWAEKLDTVELDLKHTFYRTRTSDEWVNNQVQLNTVYFTVPERYFEQYGKLQRIKAEWYEYKTQPILVTSNKDFYDQAINFIGVDLPFTGTIETATYDKNTYYTDQLPYGVKLLNHNEWNFHPAWSGYYASPSSRLEARKRYQRLPWLLPTKDFCAIEKYDPSRDITEIGGVESSAIERYIYDYSAAHGDGERLNIKDGRTIAAELFEEDIDESRKLDNEQGKIQKGYSYYDFDVDTDLAEIETYKPGNHNFFENLYMYGFWNTVLGKYGEVERSEKLAPILVLDDSCMAGSNEEISARLKVHISDVEALKAKYASGANPASGQEKSRVVLFRFAVSEYFACKARIYQYDHEKAEVNGAPYISYYSEDEAYCAQESVFSNFDVIQLSFNDKGAMKVISVVASPVDIISPLTPPVRFGEEAWKEVLWWLIGVTAGTLACGIIAYVVKRKRKQRKEGQNGD